LFLLVIKFSLKSLDVFMNRMNGTLILSLMLGIAGCGKGAGGGVTPTPVPRKPQFAYVLNSGDNTVSMLSLGSAGQLTPLAIQTIPTGNNPRSMVIDRTHNAIFVANLSDDSISQFSIGSDGELRAIAAPIATEMAPNTLVTSPDNRFVYSMNMGASTIGQYSVGASGELSLAAVIPHDDYPMSMVFSPSGHYAYVVNAMASEISQFAVALDGSLSPLSPARVASAGCPSGPLGAKKTSDGSEVIYVLSCATSEIEVYAIGTGGTLTSQQVIQTGLLPTGMDVTGSNIYVTNLGDSTVSMYSIQADGSLQALAQPSVVAGVMPETLTLDSEGKFAYVLDSSVDKILQFSIAFDGQLVPTSAAPVSSGSFPTQIIVR
jgi:6-phosphogluconolactonase